MNRLLWTTRWLGAGAIAFLLVTAALGPSGCVEMNTASPGDPTLPTLADLRPRPIPVPGEPMANPVPSSADAKQPGKHPAATAIDPHRRLVIQRYLFFADDPKVTFALNLLDKPAIAADTFAAWKANGMDWGRIDADQFPMWLTNLPRPISTIHYIITPGSSYMPIPLSGTLVGAQRVNYVDRPDHPPRVLRLIGGRYQMLMRLVEPLEPADRARVEILPHHFGPRPSLLPRSPDEKMLDGTTFDALSLIQPIPANQIWLLWVCPSRGAGADHADAEQTASPHPDTGTDSTKSEQLAPATPARQVPAAGAAQRADQNGLSLGKALLTGHRSGKAVQILLMFAVQ